NVWRHTGDRARLLQIHVGHGCLRGCVGWISSEHFLEELKRPARSALTRVLEREASPEQKFLQVRPKIRMMRAARHGGYQCQDPGDRYDKCCRDSEGPPASRRPSRRHLS